MNEKVKIISDGIHTEVWIDGIKCTGVSRVEFAHIIPTECSTLKLDYIVPAIKSKVEDECVCSQGFKKSKVLSLAELMIIAEMETQRSKK